LTLDCGALIVVDDFSDGILLNRWSLCNLMEMVKGQKVGDGEGNQAMVMIYMIFLL
jgi:hypothetical protein